MKRIVKCGVLFDGTGSDPAPGKSVLIVDDRVEEVFESDATARRPDLDNVETVDASNQWVLPGLINVHDHLTFRDLIGHPYRNLMAPPSRLSLNAVRNSITALRRGWTTIRDMGASGGLSLQFKEYIANGAIPGPRVLACGSPVCVTGGHGHVLSIEADGPYEVRKVTRAQLDAGADFIKVIASHDPIAIDGPEKTRPEMALDEIEAAYEQARAYGKRTSCHVMGTIAIKRVLDAGVNVISHGFYLNDELAEQMAAQNVYYDPTLSSYGRQTIDPKLKRGEEWIWMHMNLIPPMEEAFRAAVRAGVRIVTGTDSAGRYAEDVEMMRGLGLPAKESLLACTRYAAEALAIEGEVGTVEPGKIADLVVLGADPMADPYAIEDVVLVLQSGKPLKPQEIMVESEVAY